MNPASLLYAIPLPCALYRTVADTRSRQMEYSCIDCNEALAELLGKNCRDIIGRTPSELIPGIGKDMEDWLHTCARVAESGVSEELEYYSPTFETWFRIHVFSTGEDEVGIILQDIHAQKKMEEAAVLHKQHELLASQSKDILYRYQLGPEPGYTYVSPSAAEITGYTPEEFYRDPQIAYKLVHPDDEQHLKELSESDIYKNEPLCLRWLHKDGATIWMELRQQVERDNSGTAAAIHGLARDITESRLTEISLRDSRLELSQILSAVSDMVVYYNSTDMRIVWANQAAEESAGAEPGGLIGRTCHSIWSSNPGEPCAACPVIRCFHTHTKQSGEHTTRKGENWIIHAYPVISTTGTFIGVVETA
ncbi:MAG: PAS domain-containing protein, partial [Spirochaeta sp.]